MATAHDVAAYILSKQGPISTMKLQKLVYYSQAWSLAWDERPLFHQTINAWADGPVVPELFDRHRGMYMIEELHLGDVYNLDGQAKGTIDAVLRFYGNMTAEQLRDLTHKEEPWQIARARQPDGSRGNEVITHSSMEEYYSRRR